MRVVPDPALPLRLRTGDIVEVRSRDEILAMLDKDGSRDSLPFMPEMLQHCGQRFTVYKRADKTCDTVGKTGSRRMHDTVHLDGVRCDGASHGGCQAGCLIYWKEAWLKPADGATANSTAAGTLAAQASSASARCTEEMLVAATRRPQSPPPSPQDEIYVCQATELPNATSPLPWWDIRQYLRDVTTGNVSPREFVRTGMIALFNILVRQVRRVVFTIGPVVHRLAVVAVATDASGSASATSAISGSTHPRSQGFVASVTTFLDDGLVEYPQVRGRLQKTPAASLGLRPGEYVQVKTKAEIEATLDVNNKNRGLLFDVEMLPYCGGRYRVLRRVERIINERTGRMRNLPNDCIVLDGVVCQGCLSRDRRMCSRSIYSYWREIWLRRVE